ncbi:MAG: hypothetical protein LBR40_05625 [Bacilli bacterium]|nr:hypothetical protein [Bacilli bacterium]
MVYYIIILIILASLFSLLLLRTSHYQNNDSIKIYQSYDILRNSLIKYKEVTRFLDNEVELNNYVVIKIKDNQVYEYPGYMPYFQNIEQASFIYENKTLYLSFNYQKNYYKQVIFYDK